MNLRETLPAKEQLLHAYVFEGDMECEADVLAYLEEQHVAEKTDMYVRQFARFSIEDARALQEGAQRKAFRGGKRVFVLTCASITGEAQNALLKLFEEPPEGVLFFLIVPSEGMLLPTLRSRVQVVVHKTSDTKHSAQEFLAASPVKRLAMLEPIIAEQDISGAMHLLASIEQELSRVPRELYLGAGVKAVYRTRRLIAHGGASLKQVLEHLALLLPRIPQVHHA